MEKGYGNGEPQTMARSRSESSPTTSNEDMVDVTGETTSKGNFGQRLWGETKRPGSAIQIVIAAIIAIAIGVGVSASVDNIPEAAPVLLEIPGDLWLRALRCVGMFQRAARAGDDKALTAIQQSYH